jgi:hypothetical protein
MVGKVPTFLWRWLILLVPSSRWQGRFLPCCGVGWSCWFLVLDGRKGFYLAVTLVGPAGSWFKMVGKVPTLLWRWLVLLVPGSRW